jgi:hypothetical protein
MFQSAQLCLVIPVGASSGAHPEHPIAPGGPQPPLGIWGGGNVPMPTPPIYYPPAGGSPPGIWPSPGHPAHPIAPGGPPPGIWPSPGHPAHPIAPGGPPPGYWGGVAPPHPDQGLPGGGGEMPPGIWGGGNVPYPTPPIYLPIGDGGRQKKLEAKSAWTPETGWVVVFVPASDEATVPTPSDT